MRKGRGSPGPALPEIQHFQGILCHPGNSAPIPTPPWSPPHLPMQFPHFRPGMRPGIFYFQSLGSQIRLGMGGSGRFPWNSSPAWRRCHPGSLQSHPSCNFHSKPGILACPEPWECFSLPQGLVVCAFLGISLGFCGKKQLFVHQNWEFWAVQG